MTRIRAFFAQWLNALQLFPIAHIILTVITIVLIYNTAKEGITAHTMQIIFACLVALPVSIIGPLSQKITGSKDTYITFSIQIFAIIIGTIFYFFIPVDTDTTTYTEQIFIMGTIIIARLALLFSIGWTRKNNEFFTRSWIKNIVGAVILGGIAGGIIRGGISACIASVNFLFAINIDDKIYAYVGSMAMGFFMGTIALVYLSHQHEERKPDYNRAMRIFGHYIFFPLTVLYGCILLSYGIKILLTGIRPEGIVSYMVMGYVGFGLLTRYTTYPALPNLGLQKAHNVLFISFILVSILLLQAITIRVQDYGITINRYLILAVGICIILMSILCLIWTQKRFVVITGTLVLTALVCIYGGPFSANRVAEKAQKNLLTQRLQKNNISIPLASGSLRSLPQEEIAKIYESIDYLVENHTASWADTIFSADEKNAIFGNNNSGRIAPYKTRENIINYLGIENIDLSSSHYSTYFSFYTYPGTSNPILLSGYNTMYFINNVRENIDKANNSINIPLSGNTYTINMKPYMDEIYTISNATNPTKDENNMFYIVEQENIKIFFSHISGERKTEGSGTNVTEKYSIDSYSAYVLIK